MTGRWSRAARLFHRDPEAAIWAAAERYRAERDTWERWQVADAGPTAAEWLAMAEREIARMDAESMAARWAGRSALYVEVELRETEAPDRTLLEGLPPALPPSPSPRPWQIASAS